MPFFPAFRRFTYRAAQAWGLSDFQKPRQYAVRIEAKIHNPTRSNVFAFIVMPIPGSTKAQQVHDEPTLEPRPELTGQDEKYGNRYASWNLELRAGTVTELREYFMVRVAPNAPQIRRTSMDEYERIPAHKIAPYLSPTPMSNSEDERVRTIAKRILKKETDPCRIARVLNAYVIRDLTYGDPINGLYSSSDALTRPRVDCGGFASLFVALAKAVGIPARIVAGCWAGSKNGGMHAWAEWLHPSGVWIPVDPATESLARAARTKKSGRFGFVGSDHVTLSIGDSIPIRHAGGTATVDILQHPAVFVGNERAERLGIFIETQFVIPRIWRA